MKLSVRDIKEAAREVDPNNIFEGVDSWSKLIKIMFSPRGMNFCITNKFPALEQFRSVGRDLSGYGVFTDAGKIHLNNCSRLVLVGNTEAVITISDDDIPLKIMVMHGAKAMINSTGSAVIGYADIDGDVKVNILGKRSLDNMIGIHPELVMLMCEAMKETPVNFVITEGVRTVERQQELYEQGRTRPGNIVTYVDGIRKKSNHQPAADGYGYAVDLYPCIDGKVSVHAVKEMKAIASHIREVATGMNIPVVWGGDWKWKDYPHFELVRAVNKTERNSFRHEVAG